MYFLQVNDMNKQMQADILPFNHHEYAVSFLIYTEINLIIIELNIRNFTELYGIYEIIRNKLIYTEFNLFKFLRKLI